MCTIKEGSISALTTKIFILRLHSDARRKLLSPSFVCDFFVIQPEALTRTTLNYPMEIRGHNADKLFILQGT